MHFLSKKNLLEYREQTYRISARGMLHTPEEARNFIDERGFIFFWPVKGIDLPSLWVAAAGDRPVPDEHDDPGHKTWGWKDNGLGKHLWYYAKVLRHKGTFISLALIPYFYALSPNYGDPEEDYLLQYQEGTLTSECKQVFEALLREGPLDTISLKKAARISSAGSEGRFAKALDHLQAELKILPVGTAEVGAWKYAYIYDLTHRHMPELPKKARLIGECEARHKLVVAYFKSVGAAPVSNLKKIFGWAQPLLEKTIQELITPTGPMLVVEIEGVKDSCLGLRTLDYQEKV
ncbi:MAG: winged helix DNA-binding domain-containing protein [Anaerolineaceae bacterium]|nr:winged helix DNA-binding domain-containing protein [Anaerolineaceae bacterium]